MAHRNANFYSQDITFRVEDELFKVSQHLFVQHSQVFRDMFNIPQPEGVEADGSSDERPLILEGIEKQDFIQLLTCLYPLRFQRAPGCNFSLDQWKSVLKLSNLFAMIEVKEFAVDCMTPLLKAESPSLQIHLAQVHDVPKWLEPAKSRLIDQSNPINENDVRLIGLTFALEVCALREKGLREKVLGENTNTRHENENTLDWGTTEQPELEPEVLPKKKNMKKYSYRTYMEEKESQGERKL